MMHEDMARSGKAPPTTRLEKILPLLSVVTLLMTLPQVLTIWLGHDAHGVSLLSWGTYLVSACLWFFHGLQKQDKTIYVACVGWILMDAAVVVGVLVYS
jgi:MtN3 and saliva related transmembrane protein